MLTRRRRTTALSVERCDGDRHHFRFIVSPEDATELGDLKAFTRDFMGQAERDLGTRLDWVAVDHWNTEHPHVHVLVRGKTEDGRDLVISRDYISRGVRSRAQELLTQGLGPRTDLGIRQSLESEVKAERLTRLDRILAREAGRSNGVIDLRAQDGSESNEFRRLKVARVRKLEELGAAEKIAPSEWILADRAEKTLRELGQRNDIIKRLARGLEATGVDRDAGSFVVAGESLDQPIVGRLVARGLDDELKGNAYAVVDGIDGRVHHIRLPNLDAVGNGMPAAGCSSASHPERKRIRGRRSRALQARADHLVGEGLARRQGQRLVLIPNLIATLRRRDIEDAAAKLSAETGLPYTGRLPRVSMFREPIGSASTMCAPMWIRAGCSNTSLGPVGRRSANFWTCRSRHHPFPVPTSGMSSLRTLTRPLLRLDMI